MVGSKPTEDGSDALRQVSEALEASKADLERLRAMAEQAVQLSQGAQGLGQSRSERDAALLKLGEAYYKLLKAGEVNAPAALKRLVGEVKAKEAALQQQKADIAAMIQEADSLAEKGKRAPARKKAR